MWKRKSKVFLVLLVLFMFWYFFGLAELQFENFTYPLEGDISLYVSQLLSNRQPDVEPINSYDIKYNALPKCELDDLDNGRNIQPRKYSKSLTIIVKSAVKNVERREVIRNTWGAQGIYAGVSVRTLFNLGRTSDGSTQTDEEVKRFGDIIQSDFEDSYYNNTYKMIMGLKYAYQYCMTTDYYILVDDDYYVSLHNVLKVFPPNSNSTFYSGTVHIDPPVYRNPIRKWYVPLEAYQYNKFPNFVAGGFIMLTKSTLNQIYLASRFTKHFIFDDVFIGIIAFKLQIKPTVNEDCHIDKVKYKGPESYKSVIATHGYDDSEEMLKVWNECRQAGYS